MISRVVEVQVIKSDENQHLWFSNHEFASSFVVKTENLWMFEIFISIKLVNLKQNFMHAFVDVLAHFTENNFFLIAFKIWTSHCIEKSLKIWNHFQTNSKGFLNKPIMVRLQRCIIRRRV